MNISQFRKLEYQDIRKMTTEEIKSLVRYGANVLNRRINALERAKNTGKPIATDALDYIERTGGLFNLVSDQMTIGKNGQPTFTKDRTELIKELKREIYFANLETSQINPTKDAYGNIIRKGALEVQKERQGAVEELILKDYDPEAVYNMSQEDINKLVNEYWEGFTAIREEYRFLPSDQVKEIYDTYNKDPEAMKEKLEAIRGQMHEEEAELWRKASEETGYKPKWETF